MLFKKWLAVLAVAATLATAGTAYAKTETADTHGVTIASDTKAPARSTDEEKTVKKPDFKDKRIEINLASRLLTLYQGDVGIRMYPIAPGKPSSPTPVGRRKVVEMQKDPDWVDPDSDTVVKSGPDCPLGYRWIGIGGNYGIHGTNAPWAIGSYASHGCVRMQEKDVEDLFDHIVVGIPVDILYERAVVEKTPDNQVVYYIYPDGYGEEPLDVKAVRKKLDKYGAGDFADEKEIQSALWAENGEPHYVAKLYPVVLDGKKLSAMAVGKGEKLYIPASRIARAMGMKTNWSPNWKQLTTPLGKAAGTQRGRAVYIDAADAPALLGLNAKVEGDTCVMEPVKTE